MSTDTRTPPVDLSVRLARMDLANPVLVASGTWGYGTELPEILDGVDLSHLGGITLKGIFLEPRRGNPTPRLVETPSGLLNSIGLEGVGVKAMIHEILPALQPRRTKIIVNICGSSVEEYRKITHELVQGAADLFDAVEVNISCPNLDCGGMEFGTDPNLAAQVTEAVCAAAAGKPLLVKLTPLVTDIRRIALAVADAGADALSLVNTYPAMMLDLEHRKPVLGMNFGGLSGPAIKPLALRVVYLVFSVLRDRGLHTDMVGMGGICTGRDALEYMVAGANAVALGTINFIDPLAYKRVIEEMKDLVRRRFEETRNPEDLRVSSWTGTITLNPTTGRAR